MIRTLTIIVLYFCTQVTGNASDGIACGEITPTIEIHWIDKNTETPIPNVEIHTCSDVCKNRNLELHIQDPATDSRHIIFYGKEHFTSNSEGISTIKLTIPASGSVSGSAKFEPIRAYADVPIYFRIGIGAWHSLKLSQVPGIQIYGRTAEEISRCIGTVRIDRNSH